MTHGEQTAADVAAIGDNDDNAKMILFDEPGQEDEYEPERASIDIPIDETNAGCGCAVDLPLAPEPPA